MFQSPYGVRGRSDEEEYGGTDASSKFQSPYGVRGRSDWIYISGLP